MELHAHGINTASLVHGTLNLHEICRPVGMAVLNPPDLAVGLVDDEAVAAAEILVRQLETPLHKLWIAVEERPFVKTIESLVGDFPVPDAPRIPFRQFGIRSNFKSFK